MDISARSFLTAGLSLTAATSIALAPLTIPAPAHAAAIPDVTKSHVTMSQVRLTATPAQIAAAIAVVQGVLDDATGTVAEVAGLPGRALIGIAGDIETFFDVALTGLIDAAADPAAAASLSILRTLAVDAWAKLEENLGLINPAITTATEQVGRLLTSAVTGSLQSILVAVADVFQNPLSPASYAGVLNAALASGQLLIGNGLRAVQRVGDAGFDVVGIAVRELTFQFTNLIGGASALLTQLGQASGIPAIGAVLGAVRDLVLTPARALIDLGSGLLQAGLTSVNAGFDLVLGAATDVIDPPEVSAQPSDSVASSVSTVSPPDMSKVPTLTPEATVLSDDVAAGVEKAVDEPDVTTVDAEAADVKTVDVETVDEAPVEDSADKDLIEATLVDEAPVDDTPAGAAGDTAVSDDGGGSEDSDGAAQPAA